jgi:hypothetical protein
MSSNKRSMIGVAIAAAMTAAGSIANAGAIVSGNDLIVVRVGAGGATAYPSGSAPVPVFLDEWDVSGATAVLKNTIPLPTTGSGAFTLPATSDHDGQVSQSVNGQFLVLGGYREAVGSTATLHTNTAAASDINRVVARVGANGVADTSTALAGASDYNKSSIRSVASLDGSQFWTAGNDITKPPTAGADAGGLRYAVFGANSATGLNNGYSYDVRTVGIFGGQMFGASSSSNSPTGPGAQVPSSSNGKDVYSISTDAAHGGSIPTPGGVVSFKSLTNVGSQSPVFLDLSNTITGVDTAYVANSAGSVDKYSLVVQPDTTLKWTFNGSINLSTVEDLTASVDGTSVSLYGSVYSGAGGGIFKAVDSTGYNVAPTASFGTSAFIALPDANTQFRGVAFAPSAVPEPSALALLGLGATALVRRSRRK